MYHTATPPLGSESLAAPLKMCHTLHFPRMDKACLQMHVNFFGRGCGCCQLLNTTQNMLSLISICQIANSFIVLAENISILVLKHCVEMTLNFQARSSCGIA